MGLAMLLSCVLATRGGGGEGRHGGCGHGSITFGGGVALSFAAIRYLLAGFPYVIS